jgi:hypothetical protein
MGCDELPVQNKKLHYLSTMIVANKQSNKQTKILFRERKNEWK